MAFALMFVAIGVKADCGNGAGAGSTNCAGVSCSSQSTWLACTGAGGSANQCCSWTDPTCPSGQHVESHVCVDDIKNCPAGQEAKADGTGCQDCAAHYYKASAGTGKCSYCNGTVNASKTYCTPAKVNATVTASVSPTRIEGGGTATVTATISPNANGSPKCSGEGVSENCVVTCPDETKTIVATVDWSGAPSNYVITKGSATVHCVSSEGTVLDNVVASNTTLYVSYGEPAGLTLSAKDADGKPVRVSWASSDESIINVSSCQDSAACGAVVNAVKCATKNVTVTASRDGKSVQVTVSVVGFNSWSKVGDDVAVPQDKNGHTKHEAETANGDMGDRCVAYEVVDPTTGRGEKWDRCCGGKVTEPKFCYEKPDGTREVTEYKDGYIKKDDKYCEKACYKKSDDTYEKTWYNDGYTKVEDRFCDAEPQPYCYRKLDGTYVREVYQDGYVQVEDRLCDKHCYKTGEDTYEETYYKDGYTEVEDKYCKKACYKVDEDKYEKTYYRDGYEEVDDELCAPVPDTGLSISNVLYAVGAFLVILGSGIVVYQLTKVKQQLN